MIFHTYQAYSQLIPDLAAIELAKTIAREIIPYNSILDVGCGTNSILRFFDASQKVGIDFDKETIEELKKLNRYTTLIHADIRKIEHHIKPHSHDVCMAMDVIEHLTKEEGITLLHTLETIATKKVIIFTPNGFVHQEDHEHPLQNHQSGWSTEDFKAHGYTVHGLLGLKLFRGEGHRQQLWPRPFWAVVSHISQVVFTYNHPHHASALLAVKNM